MKTFVTLVLFVTLLLTGCKNLELGRNGFKAESVTPPDDAIVSLSGRSYGIQIGQNQTTQTPEVNIGVKSYTYTRVSPTATNRFTPNVSVGFKLDQSGFSTGVSEHFTTGDAAKQTQTNGIIERLFSK